MQVGTETVDGVLVAAVEGRIDGTNARAFEDALLPSLDGRDAAVVDLAGLEYISSAGLRVLIMAAKRVRAAGGRLVLAGATEIVRSVLEASGFARLVVLTDSREAGLDELR